MITILAWIRKFKTKIRVKLPCMLLVTIQFDNETPTKIRYEKFLQTYEYAWCSEICKIVSLRNEGAHEDKDSLTLTMSQALHANDFVVFKYTYLLFKNLE